MALSSQKQQTLPIEQSQKNALAEIWREVVTENPVYQREARTVPIPASYSPEKAEALREKARLARAKWEARTPAGKLWKSTAPYLMVFVVFYLLLPLAMAYMRGGSVGPLIGPLIGSMFVTAITTASAIVTEREKRTWNALLLTRLSPAQIIGGKVANVLRTQLASQGMLLVMLLVGVARGVVPPLALLLFPLILLPTALLGTLVGIETSLWSKSLKGAINKAMWQGGGLGFLALLVVLATGFAFFGKLPLFVLLAPILYALLAVMASAHIWRRMLRDIWRAPKDFSG
ncbi:hypothetical protein [Armatimonas sp.]|uniref:hypothetical protein n=1 Tax=Armatimonas sp. TaxID=1872638 RepID=UPI003750FC06